VPLASQLRCAVWLLRELGFHLGQQTREYDIRHRLDLDRRPATCCGRGCGANASPNAPSADATQARCEPALRDGRTWVFALCALALTATWRPAAAIPAVVCAVRLAEHLSSWATGTKSSGFHVAGGERAGPQVCYHSWTHRFLWPWHSVRCGSWCLGPWVAASRSESHSHSSSARLRVYAIGGCCAVACAKA
jgi:hypothetical protein